MRTPTPSRAARIAAGISPETAAATALISVERLLLLERTNDFPIRRAERLARVYGCELNVFLPQKPDGDVRDGGVARRGEGRRSPLPRERAA